MDVLVDQFDDAPGCQSLPEEVLQVVASLLPWSDLLSSRLVCSHWRAATATRVSQLRVHVAAGCSNTAVVTEFESQSCKQGPKHGGAHSMQNPSAGKAVLRLGVHSRPVKQNPGEALAAGLQQLPYVTAVQLVLTEHTTASDLDMVLDVVGQHARIQHVTLWEVRLIYLTLQPRSYAASLHLHKLPHVRHLTIRSPVTWSLQDMWQQVAAMASDSQAGSSSSSSDRGGTLPGPASSSSWLPASAASFPALESLSIQSVSLFREKFLCQLPDDVTFPANLTQLTTPVPGQTNRQGSVACTIGESHDRYVRSLAAALPQLQSLKFTGQFEGQIRLFQGLKELTELQLDFGWLLGAGQELDTMNEAAAAAQPLLQLPQLQQLFLSGEVAFAPVPMSCLQGAGALKQLAACIVPSPAGQAGPAAAAAAAAGTLESLTCRLPSRMSAALYAAALDQVAAVGAQLKTLVIDTRHASHNFFRQRRSRPYQRPPLPLQASLTAFSNLHSLSVLSGQPDRRLNPVNFIVEVPGEVWAALRHLKQLRLEALGLGYGSDGTPLPSRQVRAMQPAHPPQPVQLGADGLSGVLLSNRDRANMFKTLDDMLYTHITLWLEDLPPGLQQLELTNYVIVLPAQQQQQQQQQQRPGVDGVGRQQAGGSSSSSRNDNYMCSRLHGLAKLSLTECCVVEIATSSSSGNTGSSSSVTPPDVSLVSVQSLLQPRVCPTNLTELQLLQVPLLKDDLKFICSELGPNLRLLQLQAAGSATASWVEQLVCMHEHVAALEAAASAGQMQQLQNLSVDFTNMATRMSMNTAAGTAATLIGVAAAALSRVGAELCRISCGFGSLRCLKLVLHLQHFAATSGISSLSSTSDSGYEPMPLGQMVPCSTSNLAPAAKATLQLQEQQQQQHNCSTLHSWLCCCQGPLLLSNMQQLCVLDVTLHVPIDNMLGDLGHGTLGRCKACGGGVGLEALRWFFKDAVPCELPACEVLYHEERY